MYAFAFLLALDEVNIFEILYKDPLTKPEISSGYSIIPKSTPSNGIGPILQVAVVLPSLTYGFGVITSSNVGKFDQETNGSASNESCRLNSYL